ALQQAPLQVDTDVRGSRLPPVVVGDLRGRLEMPGRVVVFHGCRIQRRECVTGDLAGKDARKQTSGRRSRDAFFLECEGRSFSGPVAGTASALLMRGDSLLALPRIHLALSARIGVPH